MGILIKHSYSNTVLHNLSTEFNNLELRREYAKWENLINFFTIFQHLDCPVTQVSKILIIIKWFYFSFNAALNHSSQKYQPINSTTKAFIIENHYLYQSKINLKLLSPNCCLLFRLNKIQNTFFSVKEHLHININKY